MSQRDEIQFFFQFELSIIHTIKKVCRSCTEFHLKHVNYVIQFFDNFVSFFGKQSFSIDKLRFAYLAADEAFHKLGVITLEISVSPKKCSNVNKKRKHFLKFAKFNPHILRYDYFSCFWISVTRSWSKGWSDFRLLGTSRTWVRKSLKMFLVAAWYLISTHRHCYINQIKMICKLTWKALWSRVVLSFATWSSKAWNSADRLR